MSFVNTLGSANRWSTAHHYKMMCLFVFSLNHALYAKCTVPPRFVSIN